MASVKVTALTKDCANPPRISATEAVIQENLLRFAALYDFVPPKILLLIWCDSLKDLSVDELRIGLAQVERTFVPTAACKYPTPAHVRRWLDGRRETRVADDAETAWQALLAGIEKNFHPDIGWHGAGPDPRAERAMRAAGGARYLFACPEGDLQWAKKRFIECYTREERLALEFPALPAGELMRRLGEIADRKSLPCVITDADVREVTARHE